MSLNVLVVDRAPPVPLTQGNSLIARRLFPLLEHRLTLVCALPSGGIVGPTPDDLRAATDGVFDEVHSVPREGPIPALAGWLRATAARRWSRVDEADARLLAVAQDLVAGQRFDLIHVRQLPMAPFGPALDVPARILELVDSETLASERHAQLAAQRDGHDGASGLGRARALARARVRSAAARFVERRAVAGYDAVTTVAEADATTVRSLAPDARVVVIPNGVDADEYRPLEFPPAERRLVFVGAMNFPPNVAAARHLVREVLPRLRTPGVTVQLVGRSPTEAVRRLASDRVEVTGTIDDVRPYLAAATLVVCPLVSGSGIKNKVLEAMAMARPVVATPLAVEGLSLDRGDEVALGRSPAELAAAIDRLLGDGRAGEEMGRRARDLVVRRYTWEACAAAYDRLYREVAERARRPSG
jgi:glycosyltransferase involved in cell wall biosynthesis